MRTLVYFISLLTISFSSWSFDISWRYSHYKREVGSISNKRFQTIKSMTESVSDSWSTDHFDLKLNVDIRQNDYSQYIIRLQDGQEKSLENILGSSPSTLFLTIDSSYFLEQGGLLNLAVFSHVTSSPFRRYGGRLSGRWKFSDQLVTLFVKGLYYWQQMPLDYFIDSNFQNQQRDVLLHVYSLVLGGEFSISERQKISGSLLFEDKRGERPRHWGARIKSARSLKTDLVWRSELAYIKELERDQLEDERGYFSFTSFSNTLVWEPFFEVFVALGYVFTREIEEDPRIDSKLQTGSDTYFIHFKHPVEWGSIGLDGDYVVSNRDECLYELGVKVTWDY